MNERYALLGYAAVLGALLAVGTPEVQAYGYCCEYGASIPPEQRSCLLWRQSLETVRSERLLTADGRNRPQRPGVLVVGGRVPGRRG
jgi:hypothetical protein